MQLLFPFDELRPTQENMIKDIEKVVKEKKHIVAHAPTGTGKSAASLSAALTYAINNGKDVIFVTPKHTQHQIAIETLQKIKEKFNVKVTVSDFIGKKWMCMVPGVDSLMSRDFNEFCAEMRKDEKCPYYNSIWKKNELTSNAKKVIERLKNESPMHVEELIAKASKENMCPFYIATEIAKDAKVIIADYYHIFHPRVRNAFLMRTKKELENTIIIVDEAQNLPKRIRSVLSSKISNLSIKAAVNEATKFQFPDAADDIVLIGEVLNELSDRLSEKKEAYVKKDEFISAVSKKTGKDYEELAGDLMLIGEHIRAENKRSYVGGIGSFLNEWINANDGYTRIIKQSKWKDNEIIELKLICLDPGVSSREVFDNCHSAILMSGTLTPTQMYRDILGMERERTLCKEYPKMFPQSNQLSLIVPDTTTKYTRRNEKEFKKIADWCADISNAIKGNVAIFFPSYYLRDMVLKFFERKSLKSIFSEKQGLSKKERAEVLNEFKKYADSGAVFLGVISGSFGEGIDLPGKYLNGVIVVGIPLETPDLETQALIEYYDKLFGEGWDYGYVFPAMNKTIQACGRVIRSETDRGVVVLLDERFIWKNYFKCLPLDWNIIVTMEPVRRIKEFFKE